MKKSAQGKIIRAGVAAGVVLLHFAAAYVIGGVIQSLYSGSHSENYDEIAAEPAPQESGSRGPASVAKKRTTRAPSGQDTRAKEEGREVASTGEYTFEAGGEESGTFMQNFSHYLETGNWPQPEKKAAKPADEKKEQLYGIGGPVSGSLGAASAGSSSSSGATSSATPTINVMPPFFVSNPTGGINNVTSGGFKVSATGGAALSAIRGTTSSGYRVWFNQGGQASAQ